MIETGQARAASAVADNAVLMGAAGASRIADFIRCCPQGLDTPVGLSAPVSDFI
jgi:ABC-type transport system involved in Fe-S cluster assembly fused permease/ATPase subunit